jgi:hypothetical protein
MKISKKKKKCQLKKRQNYSRKNIGQVTTTIVYFWDVKKIIRKEHRKSSVFSNKTL